MLKKVSFSRDVCQFLHCFHALKKLVIVFFTKLLSLFFSIFSFFLFFLSEANIIMCGMRCFIFLKNIRQGNGVGQGGGDNTSRKLQNFVKLLQNFVFLLSKFYLEFFPFS